MKLPRSLAAAFRKKFGIELTEAYGIIEVGLPCVGSADHFVPGSVGKLLPGYEIKLLDMGEDGIGEVCLRGRGMYSAYISPFEIRDDDAWFNTGDLGRIDEKGNVFIVGRKKSVINFMGMKVFPDEVEGVIDSYPGVRKSLVFGEPHNRYGHLPCAQIVVDEPFSTDDLRAYCIKLLSPYKVPKVFSVVDGLSCTKSGKLLRY